MCACSARRESSTFSAGAPWPLRISLRNFSKPSSSALSSPPVAFSAPPSALGLQVLPPSFSCALLRIPILSALRLFLAADLVTSRTLLPNPPSRLAPKFVLMPKSGKFASKTAPFRESCLPMAKKSPSKPSSPESTPSALFSNSLILRSSTPPLPTASKFSFQRHGRQSPSRSRRSSYFFVARCHRGLSRSSLRPHPRRPRNRLPRTRLRRLQIRRFLESPLSRCHHSHDSRSSARSRRQTCSLCVRSICSL